MLDIEFKFWVDPELAYLEFAGDATDVCWLDAGIDATRGRSYLGFPRPGSPVVESHGRQPGTSIRGAGSQARGETTDPRDILDVLSEVVPLSSTDREPPTTGVVSDAGFVLGWVGWFGYEYGAKLVGTRHHASTLPDSAFVFVDRVIIFNHASSSIRLRSSESDLGWVRAATASLELLRFQRRSDPAPPPEPKRIATLSQSRTKYVENIRDCLASIQQGNVYQICLTNEITVHAKLDPVAVYRRLRRLNPTPHSALIRIGNISLAAASPELFMEVSSGGSIATRPVKGTAPCASQPAQDIKIKESLRADVKENAENLMIVDLMRNDLSKVAVLGSVAVPELFAVETLSTVHQLVSTVTATLDPRRHPLDVIRACFPAGSMTGTPKSSAMSHIDALEGRPRGPYAGAFGYIGTDGRIELAMTIRALVISPERATIGTGGGITAMSHEDREYEEILLKARAPLAAAHAELEQDIDQPM